MPTETSSISRVGTTEPFELQVSRRQVTAHYPLFKFGFVEDVDDALETVWDGGGLYSYIPTATVLKVSSTSTADTSAGTGARTVHLYGLDADYKEIEEDVTLNGQTAVNTTNTFIRIFRACVTSAGSGGENAGTIHAGTGTVTAGVPANSYLQIKPSNNQTLMTVWTVPAGHTLYVMQSDATVATTQTSKYATISLVARPYGEVFQVKERFLVDVASVSIHYDYPLKFEEKTDIEFRIIGNSAAADIHASAAFEGVYITNNI